MPKEVTKVIAMMKHLFHALEAANIAQLEESPVETLYASGLVGCFTNEGIIRELFVEWINEVLHGTEKEYDAWTGKDDKIPIIVGYHEPHEDGETELIESVLMNIMDMLAEDKDGLSSCRLEDFTNRFFLFCER